MQNSKKLSDVYLIFSDGLTVVVLGTLCFYYPAYSILKLWLPQYEEALKYFVLLLPICVYDSKATLLISTYLKTIRKEGIILLTNLLAIAVNAVWCFVGIYGVKKIEFVLVGIVFSLMIRCNVSEILLKKAMEIKGKGDLGAVLLLVTIFIISGMYLDSWFSMVIYICCYAVYLFWKRKKIKAILQIAKRTKG